MYEQFNGLKQFEGPFCPRPELYNADMLYEVIVMNGQNNQITEEKAEVKMESENEKKEDPEPVIENEPQKEEKGLSVTNSIIYEVSESQKKKLFSRRK